MLDREKIWLHATLDITTYYHSTYLKEEHIYQSIEVSLSTTSSDITCKVAFHFAIRVA